MATSDSWPKLFTWVDYFLFALTLVVSSLVGIYHAWRGASGSTSDYLMGGRKMPILPVAMSLAASSFSATTLLGGPTDIYTNGTMYLWFISSVLLCTPIASYIYLPIFYRLQLVSANQYLEIRFNLVIRRITTILFVVKQLLYLSIVAYGPSLALSQVTGINAYVSVGILFGVCTFYTAIGGIKAVVWTDTIQIILIYGSIIMLLIKGVSDVGGLGIVWERNYNSSRIELFNIDTDPTTPHTVWSLAIGGLFYWLSWYAVDQTAVQRSLAMPSLRSAQISMWINMVFVCGIIFLCGCVGLVMYSRYFDCDPLTSQVINKADQIVPFYVMDVLGDYPGLPGLFVAGILSGALSTISSVMNAVALVVYEDFIRPYFPNMPDQTATRLVKGVSLLFSGLSFSMVFLVAQVKTILDATVSFDGAVAGSILGVFTLGIFVPFANPAGAGVGILTAFGLMMWLLLSTQIAKSSGVVHNSQMKSFSTDNCPAYNGTSNSFQLSTNLHNLTMANEQEEMPFILLRISYLWYTVIGMLIVLTLGTLVSLVSQAINIIRNSTQLSTEELNDGVANIKNNSSTEMAQVNQVFAMNEFSQ
ncbi:sodium-coupled monocarboxylate transporter 1-like isoform X1 [Daphnia pulex]|uniref:sodium-coupled monocarboxylate transporter 1-like isoform X1 n=1 Tax=Daphnia pulex TaxID=6669 RepID=UPI001EE121A9|nr:sodium-coupled monocarboxylate transporter 1-like isoform X1 [Daphnia pulex]XP_046460650.1 sodium-coupled monocarboxylate transporter 1-like isoform X1 [Daphnia pulex]XP_046460720.1 sodium-coupled monocarboxylate transporter 1-like isoform X1 [Daphnia pulex]